MSSFIQETARALWEKHGEEISSLKLVFPSRRARLFFGEALSGLISKPLWQPQYLSIDDLIWELSSLQSVDKLPLIFELYNIHRRYHDEPFDKFYGWGEMLLQDFDTIDKYMVDAKVLFANIGDLKDIEQQFQQDTPEIKAIREFWRNFSHGKAQSQQQREFLRIWGSLATIYRLFKERLLELGVGYSGMAYRMVAENIQNIQNQRDNYYFIGFNALNSCEEKIFSHLHKSGNAQFIWDYSSLYESDPNQEAGRFLRRNLSNYPQSIEVGSGYNKNLEISVISSPTDILQCKALTVELEKIYKRQGYIDKETAIVLTDENLLEPVLSSIPQSVEKINITMGYPIRNTVIYGLLERLLQLQVRKRTTAFYHADVMGLLTHPYVMEHQSEQIKGIIEKLNATQHIYIEQAELAEFGEIFQPIAEVAELQSYLLRILSLFSLTDNAERREFSNRIITILRKLKNIIDKANIDITVSVYISILRQMLQQIRVPYEGEPLGGLQIMGILETRNVDFKNVIMLSVNDDNFPGNRSANSYIPYNLRQGYGLPTVTDMEAIYGYYFYRLLQRADTLTLLYTSAADEKSTGEQSRYIYQLEYEFPFKISRSDISLSVSPPTKSEIKIEKNLKILSEVSSKIYSPSALNRYITCPMQFYYRDILRLKTVQPIDEEFSKMDVGNVLHASIEQLYQQFIDKPNPQKLIAAITSSDIDQTIEQVIEKMVASIKVEGGAQLIIGRDIIKKHIERIIKFDTARSDKFIIKHLEDSSPRPIINNFKLQGSADRLDLLEDGRVAIIDYKSGGDSANFRSIEELFDPTKERRNRAALQTLLYALIYRRDKKVDILPQLYITRLMHRVDFSPLLTINSQPLTSLSDSQLNELEEHLIRLLNEIANPEIPFTQNRVGRNCEFCDYSSICNS